MSGRERKKESERVKASGEGNGGMRRRSSGRRKMQDGPQISAAGCSVQKRKQRHKPEPHAAKIFTK